MELSSLPGSGDDGLNRPQVTPPPTPSDDRLLGLALTGAVLGAIAALLMLRWLRRNIVISRRRP